MFDIRQPTWLRRPISALPLLLVALAGCQDGPKAGPRDLLGRATVAVAKVPPDTLCLEVTATGRMRTESRSFDLVPGEPFSREATRLPTGQATFEGRAYPVACAERTPVSIATWLSEPVTLELVMGQVVRVHLLLRPNGQAVVTPIWEPDDNGGGGPPASDDPLPIPGDIRDALARLPYFEVDAVRLDGIPRSVSGHLALVPDLTFKTAETGALDPAIAAVAPAFRLQPEDLSLESASTDEQGHTHARFIQRKHDLSVVESALLLHADERGVVYNAAGTAFDGVDLSAEPVVDAEAAAEVAAERPGFTTLTQSTPELVYVISTRDQHLYLAYEITVEGEGPSGERMGDRVFVDALTGLEVDAWGLVPTSLNRSVYESFSSTPSRTEGMPPIGRQVVDANYDLLGDAYHCYHELFAGRDSFDGRGGLLRSTVNAAFTCNAFWNGSAMAFGLASPQLGCGNLAISRDVVVHELTHGVTQHGSGLVYSSESGALNEALSDIFAAVCDAWKRGVTDGSTWLVAEDVFMRPYGLRSMSDPAADGASRDHYPDRYRGVADNGGVHWNSGIANLAFKLLVGGGSHPRAKTSIAVQGIGIAAARDIFYRLNQPNQVPAQATFQDARVASMRLGAQFHGVSVRDAAGRAWDAVGVGNNVVYNYEPPRPPQRCDVTLSPRTVSVGFQGGSGTVSLTTSPSGCAWAAMTTTEWVTIEGPTSGQGNATLSFRVGSNPTTSRRVASLIVNGSSLVVSQQANSFTCVYVTSPDQATFGPTGGVGSATVSTNSLCSWTVSNPLSWITLGSTGGSGNGGVTYTVAGNPGPGERTGTLTVAGAPLVVTQAAPVAKRTLSVTALGDGSVTVGTQRCAATTCSWQFDSGTRVRLTAQGSTFRGWGGDCASAGTSTTCELMLDVDRSASADFRVSPPPDPPPPSTRTLTLGIDGSGTVALSTGGTCSGNCTWTVVDGSQVTLSVNSGTFRSWGGDCTVNENSPRCLLMMSQNRNVKALFTGQTQPPDPPPPPPPTPIFTWLNPMLNPVPLSVPNDGTYILQIDMTVPGYSGYVRILSDTSPFRTELANVTCRVPENGTPPCTASRSVTLAMVGRYFVHFELFNDRTGGPAGGVGQASLLK